MPLRKAGAVSRRDRHRKILTRQGPRDRRMRLSLEIAHKFFRLQDTLGFDKASNTVAWLLNNSKAAIAEAESLARSSSSSSPSSMSDSDCQVIALPTGGEGGGVEKSSGELKMEAKKRRAVLARKAAAFDHPLAKEWRATARAKARERTEIKIRSRRMQSSAAAAAASSAVSLHDYDDHDDSSSLGFVIKEQQQQQQQGTKPIVSNPFSPQASLVDDDDESINPSAADAAAGQAPMINSTFDYYQQQQHLSQGVNSANHLASFQNNDMMINFLPDNWGELGGPSHTLAPLTTALLFKASADHHVQFCPKSWNNNDYNNQSL